MGSCREELMCREPNLWHKVADLETGKVYEVCYYHMKAATGRVATTHRGSIGTMTFRVFNAK